MRVVADTISPSKNYAFAWRSEQGLPSGRDQPPTGVENLLIRIADGAVLAKLGGEYWATGDMRANRYDLLAAWSPDSQPSSRSRTAAGTAIPLPITGSTVQRRPSSICVRWSCLS